MTIKISVSRLDDEHDIEQVIEIDSSVPDAVVRLIFELLLEFKCDLRVGTLIMP